jgi:hypothetical protein
VDGMGATKKGTPAGRVQFLAGVKALHIGEAMRRTGGVRWVRVNEYCGAMCQRCGQRVAGRLRVRACLELSRDQTRREVGRIRRQWCPSGRSADRYGLRLPIGGRLPEAIGGPCQDREQFAEARLQRKRFGVTRR